MTACWRCCRVTGPSTIASVTNCDAYRMHRWTVPAPDADRIRMGSDAMRTLTPLEQVIYNEGERLIPGVTHDLAEVVRHRSSYLFFRGVMKRDWPSVSKPARPVTIVDLGCGVGHGCHALSALPNSQIVGVDSSPESLEYARTHYAAANITYRLANLEEFIPDMPEYDYVVSRGVFEHV